MLRQGPPGRADYSAAGRSAARRGSAGGDDFTRTPRASDCSKGPKTAIRDGTSSARTIVASREIANASPNPNCCSPDDGASDEAVELSVMTIAAAMTMSPVPPMQLVGGDGRRNQYSNSECEKTAAAS